MLITRHLFNIVAIPLKSYFHYGILLILSSVLLFIVILFIIIIISIIVIYIIYIYIIGNPVEFPYEDIFNDIFSMGWIIDYISGCYTNYGQEFWFPSGPFSVIVLTVVSTILSKPSDSELILQWKKLIAKHPRWNKQQKAEAFIAIAYGASPPLEVINEVIRRSISQERFDYLIEHTSFHNLGKFNNSMDVRVALKAIRRDLGLSGKMAGHYSWYDAINRKLYVGISHNLIERITEYFSDFHYSGRVGRHIQDYGIESIELRVVLITVPVESEELLLIEKFYLFQTNSDSTAVCNLNIQYAGGSRKGSSSIYRGSEVFISHNGVCIGHFPSYRRCAETVQLSKRTISSLMDSGILFREVFSFTSTLPQGTVINFIEDYPLRELILNTNPPSPRHFISGPVTSIYLNSNGRFIIEHHDHLLQIRGIFSSRGFSGISRGFTHKYFIIDSGIPYRNILTFSTSHFQFLTPDQLTLFKTRLVRNKLR